MNTLPKNLNPASISPGKYIADELTARQQTPAELAEQLGISESLLAQILTGDAAVTLDVAQRLQTAWGISVATWLNLEAAYRNQLVAYYEMQHVA